MILPFKPFESSERFPCGCRTAFLPEADLDLDLPHEKPLSILKAYNEIFGNLYKEFDPKRILEIGVKHGGSLALWASRFGAHDHEIVGIDTQPMITQRVTAHFMHISKVTLFTMAAPSKHLEDLGRFDLVIDDGSHIYSDIVETLEILWPKLNSGGLYVIEDWRTDAGKPQELISLLARKIIGYWPDPNPPKDAPAKMFIWRDMIILEKRR